VSAELLDDLLNLAAFLLFWVALSRAVKRADWPNIALWSVSLIALTIALAADEIVGAL